MVLCQRALGVFWVTRLSYTVWFLFDMDNCSTWRMRMRTWCLRQTQRETSGWSSYRRARTWRVNYDVDLYKNDFLYYCEEFGMSSNHLFGEKIPGSTFTRKSTALLTDEMFHPFTQRALCCFPHIPKSLCTLSRGWWKVWLNSVYRNRQWVLCAVHLPPLHQQHLALNQSHTQTLGCFKVNLENRNRNVVPVCCK